MAALLDFLEETFNGVGCADEPPVFLWEEIKGEAIIQISLETVTGRGIDIFILT